MFTAALGLTQAPTDALITLLRAIYKKELTPPLSLPDLTRHGLQYCAADLQGALRGLDAQAVTAVLVCVIAERRAQEQRAAAAPVPVPVPPAD